MGEVTRAVDDLAKQASLPEPLLIILAPPPPFLPLANNTATFWRRWLKAFELYLKALSKEELTDSSKCALLQNCLGQEGQNIFTALVPQETTYAVATTALTAYFSGDPTSQDSLLRFSQRAQTADESSEQFVSALEALLAPCDFGASHDELILSQLIEKTKWPQLRERLCLQRTTLTLATALQIAKAVECALNVHEDYPQASVDIDEDDSVQPLGQRPRRGRPQRKKQLDTNSQKNKVNLECDEKDGGSSSSPLMKQEESSAESSSDEDLAVQNRPSCPVCVDRHFINMHKLARHMRTHTKEKPFRCPLCATLFSQTYHLTRHMRVQHNAAQHVCPMCCISFESSEELKSHKKMHVSQILLCPYCPKRLQSDNLFLSHIASHVEYKKKGAGSIEAKIVESSNNDVEDETHISRESDVRVKMEISLVGARRKASSTCKKNNVCPVCSYSFSRADKLARHMRTHTKEKPFRCPVCSLTFSQSYHMTRHQRQKHGMRQYYCPKCGKTLATWLELKEHRKTHLVKELMCLVCKKSFKDKDSLESHLKSHENIPPGPHALICSECGKVFGRTYHLKRHIVAHRKAANGECYTCTECHKSYAFAEDLKKHLRKHAKENSGTCLRCDQNFGSREELEAHMAAHKTSYLCSVCGKKFKVEHALRKHEQKHKEQHYYCALCRKHFSKLSLYKRHEAVHDRRECKCPHCDCVFLKLTALKYHLQTHTKERPYQCSCCVETFEDKEGLERHCLKHRKFRKERPYNCTRCDNAFATLAELTAHLSNHDGQPPLSCDICGRTFLNRNKLEKHLSIHTGERPHLCAHCGSGFTSAAGLKQHIHIHTGEKPFVCSQCTKSFRSSSGLRLHSRRHMDTPPSFECPDCGRTYGRMTELKMHQRYHTGDRPYSCMYCTKSFVSKHKLMVHVRVHTGERPYSCPHCGQTFTQTGDRNRHINKFHT